MTLKGKVVAVESGSAFTDGKRRVTILLEKADIILNRIRFPDETLELDCKVHIDLYPKGKVKE
jgi:hypothetical protein